MSGNGSAAIVMARAASTPAPRLAAKSRPGGDQESLADEVGDYGRACAVDDFIGLIDVGTAQALVLGDDPARTTFLPEHGLLLREIADLDGQHAERLLFRAVDAAFGRRALLALQ
ncbi:Imm21 family immunity protein [Acrocarpospora macrocephala]